MNSKLTLFIDDQKTEHSFTAPMRLSDLLAAAGASVAQPCGGRGTCGKCLVSVDGLGDVLSCQTIAHGDMTVRLRPGRGERIVTEGQLVPFELAPWGEGRGVAIDIGTTTVAAYLYDLSTGVLIKSASAPNPQAPFGADVITRMEKAEAGELSTLQAAITGGIRALISGLCAPETLSCAVLTGNTAMLYLLTGTCPTPIMRVPFELTQPFGLYWSDPTLVGLSPSAKVYLPRCLSAYVGADIGCALVAAGLHQNGQIAEVKPTLLIDIGTNGELVLSANGKLYGCSTAAGPAFEGAGISHGMMARNGAISKVQFVNGEMRCETIGDEKAVGLCGSGIVDALAAMLDAGLLDETGSIEDGDEYRLPGTNVSITLPDVRAIQLAKSAICAGMLTLIDHAGLEPDDIDTLLIAGGFGSTISPRSAERIGLIPEGFANKARAIGNASGMGASMALLSKICLSDTASVASACEIVELGANPCFMEHYIERMMFPEEE